MNDSELFLEIAPISLKDANDIVANLHRHHKPVIGHRFSIGVRDETGRWRGVAICGRPVARSCDQWRILEVTRVATDASANVCSMLYGAAARAARALGYEKIQTYTLADEPGTSLLASNWEPVARVKGRAWKRTDNVQNTNTHPLGDKIRWELQTGPTRRKAGEGWR